MTPETLTSVRELDSRFNDGFQVTLLWCFEHGSGLGGHLAQVDDLGAILAAIIARVMSGA